MAYPNYYYPPNFYNSNGATPDMLAQYKGQYQPMPMPQMQPMPNQQPMQPAPQPVLQNQPMTPPVNDMLWVLGEAEATSYPVAPNNSVVLWDKDRPTVYIKSVNMQGVPSFRILDYTERNAAKIAPATHECKCGKEFVPIADFKALEERFNALVEQIESNNAKTKVKANKAKEVEENG